VKREQLTDDEIGVIWARHFPMRLENPMSKAVCLAICLLVEEKASRSATGDEDPLVEVDRALISIGIPRDEFYQAELERPEDD
jgi:hypothetical protein